ncbi:hypothetical protein [Rhizobium leguminosarum]|uniref:hypothetical protein n=1 Tax=Rhizobium leguminosarum TaxID=384 RepID=UPI0013BCB52B|nr:hypothetical protein [Rhizobium leguminosarum]NEI64963.1 hypothetical protein [Rhizobium leguminosarum]
MLPEGFNRETYIAGLREKHGRILPSDIAFAVENGWLPLISQSLSEIEACLEKHGWIGRASVRQIKEKLGDLRIYVRPRRESASFPKALADELSVIRNRIMSTSVETCEICGDAGQLDNFDSYLQTLCGKHAEQRRAWIANGRKGDPFND